MQHIVTPSRRHPSERVLWMMLVMSAVCGTVTLSVSTWYRYLSAPTVISMERDYMAWNTSFPPITICPESKFDPDLVTQAVSELAEEFGAKNETALRAFVEGLAGATLMSLPDVPVVPDTHQHIPSHAFLRIIEKVSLPMNMTVVTGATDAASHDPTLAPTLTEQGVCYSFNSLVAPYVSPRYWRLGEDAVKGRGGLLELNPLDGSVIAQLSGLPGQYQLFVHGPGEVPALQSPFLTAPAGSLKRLELSTLAVLTAREVRDVTPQQRRCRFTDEPMTATTDTELAPRVPVYSYNLCRRSCRAALLLRACRCVPHLYGPMHNKHGVQVPMCEVRDFGCVTANLGFASTMVNPDTGEPFPCHCLVNCDEDQYVIESDTNNNEWFLGTDLKWSLNKYPRMRLKRHLTFGVQDLLVHVGSLYGLFLGGSVLCIVELVYFLTLRMYWHARATLLAQDPKDPAGGWKGASAGPGAVAV
ncbi:uncharacterized protein LOC117653134 [Thrips palmi]|uniref:Uncharacterized protein LOC117653134 n=1 Tax=Thrips palmi TaxID=161013 RepID=A0A6P9A8R5_THRPL|nr:uncharacterized protein LOC117653134 [Thrips palmi]